MSGETFSISSVSPEKPSNPKTHSVFPTSSGPPPIEHFATLFGDVFVSVWVKLLMSKDIK